MPVVISLLRAVNLGKHNKVSMDALRTLCQSLDLHDPQTYVQSGNVVFRTAKRDLVPLARRLEKAIEQTFGFHSDVILRTSSELRDAIAANPFATRPGIEPGKLLVMFLATDPGQEAHDKVHAIKANPEELRAIGRELYIYFPNGMGRSKLPMAAIERAVKTPGTGRNWNTVTKLLELAEALERAR